MSTIKQGVSGTRQFEAIVTGVAEKDTWVRLVDPPVEGRLASGFRGMDVGQRLRVQLVCTNVECLFGSKNPSAY